MRAAIYTRISDDRSGEGAGVARQEKECRALAGQLGWEVVQVFSDNSISASKGRKRPEYERLLDSIKAGRIDALIAWHPDRLHRSAKELEPFIEIIEAADVAIATVKGGKYDLTTATGRMTARIVGAVAQQESEQKGERVRSQKAHAAAQGARAGGPRAFGWTDGRRDIIPEEQAIVREMADRVLAGDAISAITRSLNERGIKTPRGNAWDRHGVRQLLTNPATAGLRRQPDGGVVEGQWEGAYDRRTWVMICAILSDPRRKTTHRMRTYLLVGLLEDSEGRRLVSGYRKTSNGGYRLYKTPPRSGGNGVSIKADEIEEVVTEAVLRLTDDLEIAEPAQTDSYESDAIQAELDALADQYGKGELTAGEWNAARGPLRARLAEARKKERQAPAAPRLPWGSRGLLRQEWDGLSIQARRAAIDALIERIAVAPVGSGERIRIAWRG